ncbi:hypothetical protein N7L95_28230 (plasmid) [Eleftheria terrae]|nr:hypothetical protein N7L95_28230 [Eleftheria terrae]
MKRFLYTLGCAAGAAVLSYYLVRLFGLWYGPRYIQSDEDIGNVYMASLGFMALCLVVGGVAGYKLARKQENRRAGT